MQTPEGFANITSEWHNDTNAAISPSRPELSSKSKTIVITGAGTGIGAETARSFAASGAAAIALLGRREEPLLETAAALGKEFPGTKVTAYGGTDVSDAGSLERVAKQIGVWDVLVLNAGYLSTPTKITEVDADDWWKGFEINLKGVFLAVRAFLPTHNPSGPATIIGTSTAAFTLPSDFLRTYSSYAVSKTAMSKLLEIVQAEHPELTVLSFHPGVLETDMYAKSQMSGLPMDKISLPADFAVWLASPEATFLKGKYVSANWDVDGLKAKAANIAQSADLLVNVVGL
ncbi:hypothetical protein LTR36_005718 [Oleoguttula mirabilis]|uniref:NAD(P)-binding protein n=1 Tax=Oleoguttula mirabilis TaxID=1507867 RepID=A0AAV9JDF0_9PEZI|nr:hypothetical protein LTR36_005718 [Oleoguttula mirabilis]